MFSAYANSFKIPELRQRIIFTLGLIALVRVTTNIPVPGVDAAALSELFLRLGAGAGGGLLNMFNMFSGGGLERFAIGALGIMPYISASIIMQLLTPIIPDLEKLQREGESGRQKINQYTRYLTVAICLVQGFMLAKAMGDPSMLTGGDVGTAVVMRPGLMFDLQTVIILTAGALFVMWLGEKITERGIGNGASLIIAVNIVAGLPFAIISLVRLVVAGGAGGTVTFTMIHALLLVAMFFLVTAATVMLTEGHRKIPIRYARRASVGGNMTGQTSYMPLRVNYAGVMPIIFGSAVLTFLVMIAQRIPGLRESQVMMIFSYGSSWYMALFGALILLFTYFWVANQFNPLQIADDLQRQNGYVPGVRPGQPTAEYIDLIMTRITFAGAIFLTALAILPMILSQQFQIPDMVAHFMGGTSLLIMVGVVLDTLRQVEAHLLSRHYDGFLSKGRLRSRRAP